MTRLAGEHVLDAPVHELKLRRDYFADVVTRKKTFELRLMNRAYQVGDVLVLREWNPDGEVYTGREARRRVTHILLGPVFGLEAGFGILSMHPLETGE